MSKLGNANPILGGVIGIGAVIGLIILVGSPFVFIFGDHSEAPGLTAEKVKKYPLQAATLILLILFVIFILFAGAAETYYDKYY